MNIFSGLLKGQRQTNLSWFFGLFSLFPLELTILSSIIWGWRWPIRRHQFFPVYSMDIHCAGCLLPFPFFHHGLFVQFQQSEYNSDTFGSQFLHISLLHVNTEILEHRMNPQHDCPTALSCCAVVDSHPYIPEPMIYAHRPCWGAAGGAAGRKSGGGRSS